MQIVKMQFSAMLLVEISYVAVIFRHHRVLHTVHCTKAYSLLSSNQEIRCDSQHVGYIIYRVMQMMIRINSTIVVLV